MAPLHPPASSHSDAPRRLPSARARLSRERVPGRQGLAGQGEGGTGGGQGLSYDKTVICLRKMTEEALSSEHQGLGAQLPHSHLSPSPGSGHWCPTPATPGPVGRPHFLSFPMSQRPLWVTPPTLLPPESSPSQEWAPPPFIQLLGPQPLGSSLSLTFLSHPSHQLTASSQLHLQHAPRIRPLLTTPLPAACPDHHHRWPGPPHW